MPSTKISALPSATILNGTDVFPIVQSGANKKATINLLNFQEVTYTQLQTLISGNNLIIGQLYKITGFNKNMPSGNPENPNGWLPEVLFDDGTNSGITIYMTAITSNQLSSDGWGEFYNPKYIDGYSYYNTDGTGLYGIWDGNNPDPLQVPAYSIGQVVFWGGYAWENVSGNVGFTIDVLTLSNDWSKIQYSDATYYEKVIDEIKVDWLNGILVERYNAPNQIRVSFNAPEYLWWMYLQSTIQCNPISGMAWGLYSKVTQGNSGDYYGVTNFIASNSQCEVVNFKGIGMFNISMNDAYIANNYFGIDLYFDFVIFDNYASLSYNKFINNARFENCKLSDSYITATIFSQGYFYSLNFQRSSIVYGNFLSYNSMQNCNFINSVLQSNQFNNSIFRHNYLSSSYFSNNTFVNMQINTNQFENGSILYNYMSDSIFDRNIFSNSNFQSNVLEVTSQIIDSKFYNSDINNNQITDNSNLNEINCYDSEISENMIQASSSISNTNLINGSEIKNNNIYNNSFIIYCDLISTGINSNQIQTSSSFQYNYGFNSSYASNDLLESTFNQNILKNSSIISCTLFETSFISNDLISSVIQTYNLNASRIEYCNLIGSTWDGNYSSVITNPIRKVTCNHTDILVDLSTANHIYYNTEKTLFTRYDGTPRLAYYNTNDNPIHSAINA